MGLIANGATFTFTSDKGNLTANVAGISVESPEAQLVDMTTGSDPVTASVLVPTGELKGGSISVDYIRYIGQPDPKTLVGGVGNASFSSTGFSVSKQVCLTNTGEEARFGDVVRGTLSFTWTDYFP